MNDNTAIETMPKATDGDDTFVVLYKTIKHGEGKNEVSWDYYQDNFETNSDELRKRSFNGKGDNMQWSSVLWRFSVSGNVCLMQVQINSVTRKAGTAVFLTPKGGGLPLPDGTTLNPEYVKNFPSYPFSDMGELRDFKELARDGKLSFVDVGDKDGVEESGKVGTIVSHLKSTGSVNFTGSYGAEFGELKTLRYLGPAGDLRSPAGLKDLGATRRVEDMLKKAPEGPKQESVFNPKEEPEEDKNKRFSNLEEGKLRETNKALSETNRILSEVSTKAKSTFGKNASVHNVVMRHLNRN
jgi:hypothetical protein